MATLLYYLIRSEHRLHRKSEEEQSILVDKGRLLSDLIHSTLSKIETVAGKKLRAGKSWSSARSSRPFLTLKSFSSKTAPVKLAHLQAPLIPGHEKYRDSGFSSSAPYGMLQKNPQSASSYSLRVLKSLHEIFRASFSHPRVKTLPKQLTCVAKTLSKNTRVKRVFLKHFLPPKTLSLQVTTVCELPKQVQAQLGPSPTQEKHAPTSLLPLLLLQHNYRTVLKLPSATKASLQHSYNNKNSRTPQRQASGQNNMHFATKGS